MSDAATACACGSCATCSSGAVPMAPVADAALFRHGAIKARLLARIGGTQVLGTRPLDMLGMRDDDDPAIALIDAFAGSLHILAWNAARLADDGTLARSEDRDALVDLTRLLGYQPRPALAATTTLAFTLETRPGAPAIVQIAKGTKVASVPGQDELPQTFETDAALEARGAWNALRPVLAPDPPTISMATRQLTILGSGSTIKAGDTIAAYVDAAASTHVWLLAKVTGLTRLTDGEGRDLPPRTVIDLLPFKLLTSSVARAAGDDRYRDTVLVLGQRAAAFGANAPDLRLMSEAVRNTLGRKNGLEWKRMKIGVYQNFENGLFDLDAVYADALPDRWILLSAWDQRADSATTRRYQFGRIESTAERSRTDFAMSAKVSRVKVAGLDLTRRGGGAIPPGSLRYSARETGMFIETAQERLFVDTLDAPLPASGALDRVTIAGAVTMPAGRRVVLTGLPWTAVPGSTDAISEVAILREASVPDSAGASTLLIFEQPLTGRYRARSLRVLGNCAPASHGETPAGNPVELIGSGSASALTPRFALKRAPLAYVPANNPRGYAPAIEVQVGDRAYAEAPTLFGLPAESRSFTVRALRDGKAEVQFAGRLPTGTHNVRAIYRTGGGVAGNLPAGRITTAMTPVMGVAGVANPVPAEGASDAETIDDLRRAAPQSIRTLDRVVSLEDFGAFARGYRGIGKALATELHAGMRSVVCLTVATTTLTPPGLDTVRALRAALALVAVPGRAIRIEGFADLGAQLTVALAIDPAFRRRDVQAAVRAALGTRFGRAARDFGRGLHRSEVLATVQSVQGVIAATLPVFALPAGMPPESDGRLPCPVPTLIDGVFTPAGLLAIDPATVQFAEMTP